MGESAKEQRERIRKGLEGEYLAMDFLDAHQISYFAIEQNTHTWSQALATSNLKRPDLIIWNKAGQSRLVDVKHYGVHVVSTSLSVGWTEVRSLRRNAEALRMTPLLAFALERRFLFFLRLEDLTAPANEGQNYTAKVEPGSPSLRDFLRPAWILSDALVAWDATAGSRVGLNADLDIDSLFG